MVNKMRVTCVKLPTLYVSMLDELVKEGRFSSRSEAVRIAVREFLQRELVSGSKPKPRYKVVRLDS